MKTIKTTLALIITLTLFACKKEKKEDQPQPTPPDKYYVVEYKVEVTGQNVVGYGEYYDFNLNTNIKEFLTGNNPTFTKTFAVKNGGYASLEIDAEAFSGIGITAKGEIWIDGVKRYSDFDASSGNTVFLIFGGPVD